MEKITVSLPAKGTLITCVNKYYPLIFADLPTAAVAGAVNQLGKTNKFNIRKDYKLLNDIDLLMNFHSINQIDYNEGLSEVIEISL